MQFLHCAARVVKASTLISAAFAAVSSGAFGYTPGTGIEGTPHDFSSANGRTVLLWADSNGKATPYCSGIPWIDPATNQQGTTTLSVDPCSTCHTMEQTDDGGLQWNYTLRSTTYRWADRATPAGTPYPTFQGDTYKGPSSKCLSCHDGLLAPIYGWFDRSVLSGWGHAVSDGVDLSGTHPVAMPYPLNGVPSTYNFVRNGRLVTQLDWVPDPMATNGIRLFVDDGVGNIVAGASPGRTGIECPSCHDIHNGPRVKDQRLVTGLLSGSDPRPGGYICKQCHPM